MRICAVGAKTAMPQDKEVLNHARSLMPSVITILSTVRTHLTPASPLQPATKIQTKPTKPQTARKRVRWTTARRSRYPDR
jgi:hypothetical protein